MKRGTPLTEVRRHAESIFAEGEESRLLKVEPCFARSDIDRGLGLLAKPGGKPLDSDEVKRAVGAMLKQKANV